MAPVWLRVRDVTALHVREVDREELNGQQRARFQARLVHLMRNQILALPRHAALPPHAGWSRHDYQPVASRANTPQSSAGPPSGLHSL
jgi:hypothetical protein